jgi:hypothetical protein
LESPWERLWGGVVLGEADFAEKLLRGTGGDPQEQSEVRQMRRSRRVGWGELVRAAEAGLGRKWSEMVTVHGDWGRDGVIYVATRYGGYRLAELVGEVPGLKYQAAAQGVRRFRHRMREDQALRSFVKRLRRICQ